MEDVAGACMFHNEPEYAEPLARRLPFEKILAFNHIDCWRQKNTPVAAGSFGNMAARNRH